jgi:DNA-binding CsgD family transcriptional regulator
MPSLTERELDVLALVAQGLTNRQIGRRLFISPGTVRTHLEHIYDKLGVRSRAGAVSAAFRIASWSRTLGRNTTDDGLPSAS